jgi:predicted DNA-binding transcriptional regulator AlpA
VVTDRLAVTLTVAELKALVAEEVRVALAERRGAPRLLTREQVCEALQISLSTIARLQREGMPCVRIYEAPRFELENVVAWMKARNE